MSYAAWDGSEPRVLPCDKIYERLRKGHVRAVGLIVGGERAFAQLDPASSWWGTLDALAQFWRGYAAASHDLRVIQSADDLDRLSADSPGLLLGLEGVSPCFDTPLQDPIAALHLLVRLGVRSLQLLAATPSPAFDIGADPEAPLRLSPTGYALIAEASRLGLLIDLSHLTGDQPAFEETISALTSPPIASHHSCRALGGSPRALDDDAIRAIAAAGGVIGIHTASGYLAPSGQQATMQDLIRQIDHIVDLVGIDYVAIGTDYIDATATPIDLPQSTFMKGMEGPESLERIDAALGESGYAKRERRKILCGNVLRVWRSALARGG